MGPWQNGSGQPITDAGGAIVECADNPCTPCGVADGCHYALVVCNANSQVDDDFIIRLNGYLLGNFDGNAGHDGRVLKRRFRGVDCDRQRRF